VIAKLTGVVDSLREDGLVLDVGGVGYLVYGSARTLSALPRVGETASLLVETHVREDHIHLYGFAEAAEQDWFRLLLTVQGVGARVALAILSALPVSELAEAVALEDRAALTRANGVGGKLAQRIVSELRDKTGDLAAGLAAAGLGAVAGAPTAGSGRPQTPAGDAVSALINLGYRRTEAAGAVASATRALGAQASTEALVRAGLQELAG